MSETENNYVATATAEKRLREVLADRMPGASLADMESLAVILLDGAEITYLPRKKSVSILLRVPETASTPKRQDPAVSDEPLEGAPTVELPPDTPADAAKRAARFGQFAPVNRAAAQESEDDFFTG